MEETQIYDKLSDIFRQVFDDDSIILSPQLSAKDVDGWDSLTHLRLILTVEKAFKIRFSTTDIANLKNVGELATLIASRLKQQS